MPDFSTQEIVFGIEGLDFQRTLDQISPTRFAIASNVIRTEDGRVTNRPGLSSHITGLFGPVHSIIRGINPIGPDRYVIGSGGSVYQASEAGGAATLVGTASSYSFEPLSFAIGHTALSGDSWVYVSDTTQNRKIRIADGLDLPMGLTRPGNLASAISAASTVVIDKYENNGAWNNNAGTGAAPANAFDNVIFKEGAFSLRLTSAAGAATSAYYNFWTKANAYDLSNFPAITTAATDADQFHIQLRTDAPHKLLEFRIYFVVSTPFNTTTVPGTSAVNNTDAYIKVVRPSDFTPAYELALAQPPAAQAVNQILNALSQLSTINDPRATIDFIKQQIENARSASLETAGGRGVWTEWGVVGRPFSRGEFRRIGNDATRTWATVTGVVFVLQTVDNTSGVQVWLDDFTFFGGAGPDSSGVGADQYDWRYIHYDPRTGTRSAPSAVYADSQKLDLIRQAATLTPTPFLGDSAIRQRFYRRGGNLVNNWYYVGQNSSNGGAFIDNLSDLSIAAASTLQTDNDAPVTTVNSSGVALYQQPLACIFGPVNDIMFGCGDANRRGALYWSKPLEHDHWPPFQYIDVCPPAEELLVGFILAGQAFVFSRSALYAIYPNVADVSMVSAQPTACRRGPVARWCTALSYGHCFFIAYDGIYASNGGAEQNITDDFLRPLFRGRPVGIPGRDLRQPIDFAQPHHLRLFTEGSYLWFLYMDTTGTMQALRYHIGMKYWEGYFDFPTGYRIVSVYDDVISKRVLLGGYTSNTIYTFAGYHDLGTPINAYFFTGALDQGAPSHKKQYSDIWIDAELNSNNLVITPYKDNFTTALSVNTLTGPNGRSRYYADFSSTLSFDLGIKAAWTADVNGFPLYVHKGGISYISQPQESEGRVTDWDSSGRMSDKWVKGIIMEVDTYGEDKAIQVQGEPDGSQTITVNASGRTVLEFTWPEFRTRLLRLRPLDVSIPWILYQFRWIFDEEPLCVDRWETQPINHGHTGEQTLLYAQVTVHSPGIKVLVGFPPELVTITSEVILTIDAYRQDGTIDSRSYTVLPGGDSYGLEKVTVFVPFEATRGTLFKYLLTSSDPFFLYREETVVVSQPWGVREEIRAKPFGNDDLDLVRSMSDAGLVAARSGGGGG